MAKKISVEVTIPVYNEEVELEGNMQKLDTFLKEHLASYDVTITIADNASLDRTPEIGKKLARTNSRIKYRRFSQKGRGRAVKAVWRNSSADMRVHGY
jgi:glycosyltransferase involved in cell wall biosynthesis